MYIPGLLDGPEPMRMRDTLLETLGLIHRYTDSAGGGSGGGTQDAPPPDPPPPDPPPDPPDDDPPDDGKPIDVERHKRVVEDRNRKGKAYLEERKARLDAEKELEKFRTEEEKRRKEKLDETEREKERADEAEKRAKQAEEDLLTAKREGKARDHSVMSKYVSIVAADLAKAEKEDPDNFDSAKWWETHKKDCPELYNGKQKTPVGAGGGSPPEHPPSEIDESIAAVKSEIENLKDPKERYYLQRRLRKLERERGA